MPTYLYETVTENGAGERFEVVQSMNDAPLAQHPVSGEPIRRVITAPYISTRYSDTATRRRLDNDSVAKAGFTKYERDKLTGKYHKVAGQDKAAPSVINPHGV